MGVRDNVDNVSNVSSLGVPSLHLGFWIHQPPIPVSEIGDVLVFAWAGR
jgi:hypothetical protein